MIYILSEQKSLQSDQNSGSCGGSRRFLRNLLQGEIVSETLAPWNLCVAVD